jgi:ATP-dependent Clp protease ATP-binding subunit ClpA
VTLQVSEAARAWLGERGYKPEFGAREMGRVLREHLEKPLADAILFGRLKGGGSANVDVAGDKLALALDATDAG